MSRKIEVQILGDSKSLEAALGRSQTKTSKFGRGLAVAAKVGAGALLGLGVAAKIGFDELNDSQKVGAQTAAVLKSTGGAANVTAGHVNDLAQRLLHLSGVDDETIQSGENMLLTFRNIHNEVGRGNDIFDQATKATLDLSVATGKDMKSSAILVGKALNDPVKGLTALRRVGVQFTADQEKLIKKLVATGNTAEAQKLILGELKQEFGGSAKAAGTTLSGQLGVLKESFADVASNVVTALLPALQNLIGILSSATGWMKRNAEATKLIVLAIAALSAGIIVVNAVYKTWSAITKVVAAAQWLLNAALSANPVVLIVAGIIALGVALVIAYKKSETFRNIVGAAVDFVKKHWQILLALIPGIGPILFIVVRNFKTLRDAAGSVLGFMKSKWDTVTDAIKTAYRWVANVINKIKDLISWIGKIHLPSIDIPGIGGGGGGTTGKVPQVPGGGHTQINLHLDGKVFYSAMVSQDKVSRRQTGRSLLA